jgi:hypothetical protein
MVPGNASTDHRASKQEVTEGASPGRTNLSPARDQQTRGRGSGIRTGTADEPIARDGGVVQTLSRRPRGLHARVVVQRPASWVYPAHHVPTTSDWAPRFSVRALSRSCVARGPGSIGSRSGCSSALLTRPTSSASSPTTRRASSRGLPDAAGSAGRLTSHPGLLADERSSRSSARLRFCIRVGIGKDAATRGHL